MYQIELSINKTGKCVKKDLDEPFHRFEIPSNATFYAEGTIGSNALPGLGVNVALFGGNMGDGKMKVQRASLSICFLVSFDRWYQRILLDIFNFRSLLSDSHPARLYSSSRKCGVQEVWLNSHQVGSLVIHVIFANVTLF